MFRIDDPSAVAALPVPEAVGNPGYFTEGSPGTLAATLVRASFLNMVQEELISILMAAGIVPSKATYNQVLTAIKTLVKSSGFHYSGAGTIAASRALAATDIGSLLINSGNFIFTIGTPTSLGALPGDGFTMMNFGANTCGLAFAGCTYVYGSAGLSASLNVLAGESITFVAESGTSWRVATSTAGMGNLGSFTSSLGTQGWKRYPDANSPIGYTVEQWGMVSGANLTVDTTVPYPISFPNSIMQLYVTGDYTPGSGAQAYYNAATNGKSNFIVRASANISGRFLAKGY
ncbi:MAG: hypothetical protein ABI171_16185 [Collimonas sp.]|uniref:gp53-like domain-containing protein n=1 Tax=Collimonas sp. TaxID=1963772 RepID=UPI0032647066